MSDATTPPPTDGGASFTSVASWWVQNPWMHQVVATVVTLLIATVLWLVISRALPLMVRRSSWLAQYEFNLLRVVKWLFWLMAWIVVLRQAGIDTDSLWATFLAIAAMVAIGFIAVWSLLSNLVASVLIVATRLFKPKDDIELVDTAGGFSVRGTVRSVDMIFTTIEERREDGTSAVLKVPNNQFFQKVVRIRGG